MSFGIIEVKDVIKISHKSGSLELTKNEADRLVIELRNFRRALRWTVVSDYGIKEPESKGEV